MFWLFGIWTESYPTFMYQYHFIVFILRLLCLAVQTAETRYD